MDAKKFFYMESQEGGRNLPQKSYAEVASAFNYKLLSAIAATDGGEKDNIFVSPCRFRRCSFCLVTGLAAAFAIRLGRQYAATILTVAN